MGLSISWIASRGMAMAEMLEALGLGDSGERRRLPPVPAPAMLFAFELGEWRFVASEDNRFASRERVVAVSQGGDAVGAYLEEHVMVSGAFGARDGALIWSAQHDCTTVSTIWTSGAIRQQPWKGSTRAARADADE